MWLCCASLAAHFFRSLTNEHLSNDAKLQGVKNLNYWIRKKNKLPLIFNCWMNEKTRLKMFLLDKMWFWISLFFSAFFRVPLKKCGRFVILAPLALLKNTSLGLVFVPKIRPLKKDHITRALKFEAFKSVWLSISNKTSGEKCENLVTWSYPS